MMREHMIDVGAVIAAVAAGLLLSATVAMLIVLLASPR